MDTSEFEILSSIFEQEAAWLSKIIHRRIDITLGRNMNEYSKSIPNEPVSAILPPDFKDVSVSYTDFIMENKLSYEERLLLALAVIPHLKPCFLLNEFREFGMGQSVRKDFAIELPETGLVKSQNFGGVVPTGLTFLFFVGGSDLAQRLKATSFLHFENTLFEKKVIHLERAISGDPMYSGKLILSQVYFEVFTSGKIINTETHAN